MKMARLISLGCPKNLVDAEVILGQLTQAGYRVSGDDRPADVFIVNTCCFIREATEESCRVIEQAISLKENGRYKKIIVAGCLPQHSSTFLKETYGDKIDGFLGLFNREQIVSVCHNLAKDSLTTGQIKVGPPPKQCRSDSLRHLITPPHYAYLRIAEGCNNHCTYCIIPSLHGPYRSKPFEVVLNEAADLVSQGVKELNLIAQDTTSYGVDLYRKKGLARLLEQLSEIADLKWIRLLYTHPRHYTLELINTIAGLEKVVKYLDLPIQHISDSILRRMGRQTSAQEIKRLIFSLREKIPGLFLRTAIIVGFPGERERDFQELLRFLEEIKFERLGAFRYSPEENTPAAQLADQISEEVKEARLNMVMQVQQQIAFRKNRLLEGEILPVIIDERKNHRFIGRTYGDAPEVDGNIFVKGEDILIGSIYHATITGTKGYDLVGEVI